VPTQQDFPGRRGGQVHQTARSRRGQLGGKPYNQRDTRELRLALSSRQGQGQGIQGNRDPQGP